MNPRRLFEKSWPPMTTFQRMARHTEEDQEAAHKVHAATIQLAEPCAKQLEQTQEDQRHERAEGDLPDPQGVKKFLIRH
jgi:hypothetical protein